MAAGLPGVGLGGLFFVVVALLMPIIELIRLARGRSSGDRWPLIMRQFFIAIGIVLVAAGSFYVLSLLAGPADVSATGVTGGTPALRRLSAPRITLPILALSFGVVLGIPAVQRVLVGGEPPGQPTNVAP